MVPWRWNAIPAQKIDNTVFKQLTSVDPDKNKLVDFEKLQAVFLMEQAEADKSDAEKHKAEEKAAEKKTQPKVLSQQRCTMIEIIMNPSKITLPELRAAILKGDTKTLTIEALNELRSLFPLKTYEEEKTQLLGYKGDMKALAKPEIFMHELLSIPRIRETLSALIFTLESDARLIDAKMNMDVVMSALAELRNNKITRFLEITLVAGNYLNSGGKTPKTAAGGFRLQSLLKLTDVVSPKQKMNLLHYIVRELLEKNADVLTFTEQLPHLGMAVGAISQFQVEQKALNTGLAELRTEVAQLKTLEGTGSLVNALENSVTMPRRNSKRLTTSLRRLSARWCTGAKRTPTTYLPSSPPGSSSHRMFRRLSRFWKYRRSATRRRS